MTQHEDWIFKAARCMGELVKMWMAHGCSRVEAEKRSEEMLDDFLAKKYGTDNILTKKGVKNREQLNSEEIFNEMFRQKKHWLQK